MMLKNLQGWPLAIVAALVVFMGMTIAFVRVAFSERVDLVSKDYYYRDKEFSGRLEKEKRLLQLGETEISRSADGIVIGLPAYFQGKSIEGKVIFYSPINPAEDFELPLKITGPRANVAARVKTGQKWRVSLDFVSAGQSYFTEKVIW
ncbi:MAG TPA: FixH family protein [Turneriella sp.]|nr:FixH family protein [Turneriella sp.]HNL10432.1 FixH family protein [Turneriella sp.]HNL54943.1 FixH family protein [Turneriella sp.]HNN00006.1 FixH family protein [Turneriella sp.]